MSFHLPGGRNRYPVTLLRRLGTGVSYFEAWPLTRSAKVLANVARKSKYQLRKGTHALGVDYRPFRHLEEIGIHDESFWHLPKLVGVEIEAPCK